MNHAPLEFFEHPGDYNLGHEHEPGFYFWTCWPGCLPDSESFGPYPSAEAARAAADADAEDEFLQSMDQRERTETTNEPDD